MFKKGDYVARYSYQFDLIFEIVEVENHMALLKGLDVRLIADAPLEDLKKISQSEYRSNIAISDKQVIKKLKSTYIDEYNDDYFIVPGKILHIDSDKNYLSRCINMYEALNVPAFGVYLQPEEMPAKVIQQIIMYNPDIVVITGHDVLEIKGKKSDPYAYKNTPYFLKSVERMRQFEPNFEKLIIYAGACQSHFESLIENGANFASSPMRVNIHALDPVFVAVACSYTPFNEKIGLKQLVNLTISKEKGIGGIQTLGKLRIGYPKIINE